MENRLDGIALFLTVITINNANTIIEFEFVGD